MLQEVILTMAYPKKRNTVAATTLTGLLLAGVVATAVPANANEENSILNPLQDYSSQDYANAYANLTENTNTRQDRVEVETGTTTGGTTYTVYSETINYTRYNADGENTVDTITNYSVESDFPSDPEVVAITEDLRAEHDGSNNTYFMEPYDRSEFPGWQTRDGINQRNYVLARDLQDVEWNEEGTRVLSGWHIDPFLDERVEVDETNISSEIDIDHVLPLSYAWSDYHYKDRDARGVFSNYDMNLLAVDSSENVRKSDLSPAVYMPPNQDFHCDYALMWTHTSMTQDISLNTQDIAILDDTLHECVLNAVGEETEEMLANIEALEEGTLELSREEVENFSTESKELSWDFSAQDVDHISGDEVDAARETLLEAYDDAVNTEEPSPEPTEPEPEPSEDPTPEPEPTDEPEEQLTPEASLGMDILEAGGSTFINILGFQPYESVDITVNDEVLAVLETDEEGYVNEEITIPEDLDAGEHTMTVTGQESGETVNLSFTVLEQDEDTVITPDAPQYNRDDNTVTLPDVEGVEYSVDGEPVSGTLDIPEDGLTITVSALEGFVLSEDAVTEWVYTHVSLDEDENESEIIEITAPRHNQEDNTVTIPETEGLDYVVDGEIVTGTIDIPESGLTVTVELHEGYSFIGTDTAPVWTFDYYNPQEEEVNEEQDTNAGTDDTNTGTVVNDTRDDRDATASDDTDTTVDRDTDSTVALERADSTTVELDENGEPVRISSGNTPSSSSLAAGGAIALGSIGALAYGATRIRKAAHK